VNIIALTHFNIVALLTMSRIECLTREMFLFLNEIYYEKYIICFSCILFFISTKSASCISEILELFFSLTRQKTQT